MDYRVFLHLLLICLSCIWAKGDDGSDCGTAGSDCGQPLFLTPHVESGDVRKARDLSRVGPLPRAPELTSYSGYFTVNKEYNSNLFFWFFPAQNGDKYAPLLMWLQGGPGSSSLFGLFVINGPYVVDSDMNVKMRPHHWAQNFQILYVDNPVGTGFSFTESDRGYATNQTAVGADLYEMLQQFFTVFHEYRSNDFYVTGESYAGKYVPAIAYKIHTEGSNSNINLKGIVIGNGLSDAETQVDYHEYFYQLGLIDRKQRCAMRKMEKSMVHHIRRKEFYNASIDQNTILPGVPMPYKSELETFTGFEYPYNYLITKEPDDFSYYMTYIQSPESRKAIHVGNMTFSNGTTVLNKLLEDLTKSVKPWVATLMDNYKVLFYNGQLDLIIPYPLTVNFLSSVDWKYANEYRDADRVIWRLNGTSEIAGYVHNVKDFYEVMVRNAGHVVPHDQPEFALDLITRFIRGIPFSE